MSGARVPKTNLLVAALAALVATVLGASLLYAIWIGLRNLARIGV